MNRENFKIVFKDIIQRAENTLQLKNSEYASSSDVLSNFKKAASALGETPEKALRGMWIKHVISIVDFIDDIDRGVLRPLDLWREKITDSINYLILLEAMLVERYQTGECVYEENCSFIFEDDKGGIQCI